MFSREQLVWDDTNRDYCNCLSVLMLASILRVHTPCTGSAKAASRCMPSLHIGDTLTACFVHTNQKRTTVHPTSISVGLCTRRTA